jgi:hypothetical protein
MVCKYRNQAKRNPSIQTLVQKWEQKAFNVLRIQPQEYNGMIMYDYFHTPLKP